MVAAAGHELLDEVGLNDELIPRDGREGRLGAQFDICLGTQAAQHLAHELGGPGRDGGVVAVVQLVADLNGSTEFGRESADAVGCLDVGSVGVVAFGEGHRDGLDGPEDLMFFYTLFYSLRMLFSSV